MILSLLCEEEGYDCGVQPTFRSYLTRIQVLNRKLFLKGVEIDNYSFRRSLRRGATAHAMNNNVPKLVIDEINRWRLKGHARGGEVGLSLTQVYSSVRHTIPTKIKHS